MLFYCPSCREEYDVETKTTITTKSGRVAHIAPCPVCEQDMVEFIPNEKTDTTNPTPQADK